jgi:hypothetical protein
MVIFTIIPEEDIKRLDLTVKNKLITPTHTVFNTILRLLDQLHPHLSHLDLLPLEVLEWVAWVDHHLLHLDLSLESLEEVENHLNQLTAHQLPMFPEEPQLEIPKDASLLTLLDFNY